MRRPDGAIECDEVHPRQDPIVGLVLASPVIALGIYGQRGNPAGGTRWKAGARPMTPAAATISPAPAPGPALAPALVVIEDPIAAMKCNSASPQRTGASTPLIGPDSTVEQR